MPPPLIRLILNDAERFTVIPNEGARPESTFAPFQLPRLPLSQHCWLAGLGAAFLRRHRRCLAALLVLECCEHRWLHPRIPAQACGTDGTCWTLDLGDDGPFPAGRCIGGSFQVRLASDVLDAGSSVPRFDGLHMVQAAGEAQDGDTTIYYFVHHGGQTTVVLPEDVTVDDWDLAFREAASRMTFD